MKTTIDENDDNFFFQFQAETKEEAALLVRMGMTATNELKFRTRTFVSQGGCFDSQLCIGRAVRGTAEVQSQINP